MPYNRYEKFTENGVMKVVPFIEIKERDSDKYEQYMLGQTRFDLLSYKYYGDSDYGWLILQANPSLPPYEFMITPGETIRIPYPLEQAIIDYEDGIEEYNTLNGTE